MTDPEFSAEVMTAMTGDGEMRIPIVEEEAQIVKRVSAVEQVTVRTIPEEHAIVLRDQLSRDRVEVTRVPIDREVAEAPPTRTEGDVTVVSVIEERMVVEKRLFVVEELHLRRTTSIEQVEVPTTVRRMRVEIDRTPVDHALQQEEL